MDTRRKLPRFAAVVACAAALVLSACTSSDDSDTYTFSSATAIGKLIPAKDRKPAPTLEAKRLTGNGSIAASQFKGKPVVLAFWASWCGPCRVEMPQLSQLNQQLGGQVGFIGVNTKDDRGPARAFLASNKIGFASVYDQPGDVALKLGNIPSGLPFTVLLDRSGKVAAVYVVRYGAKDLSGALTTLRAET